MDLTPASIPFQHVAVLKGGPSTERAVSLRSGAAVAAGLREAGYRVTEIDVTDHTVDIPAAVEAVFIALHGEFGEDGAVQALLEARGLPYTGAGVESSRVAFDKILTKERLEAEGIPTPAYRVTANGTLPDLPLPLVVKPVCQGSTIGVHRVAEPGAWGAARADAQRYGSRVMAEVFIPGREVTVGIVGDEALPVIEIDAPDAWYDYAAKYTQGMTRYLVPAPVAPDVAERCAAYALGTFRAVDCRGFARVDFRLAPDGVPYVLEINTIPGFTETSLLPKAAAEAGMTFSVLCDRIMRMATCDNKQEPVKNLATDT